MLSAWVWRRQLLLYKATVDKVVSEIDVIAEVNETKWSTVLQTSRDDFLIHYDAKWFFFGGGGQKDI